MAVDTLYGGHVEEGARLTNLLTGKSLILMGNHGVMVTETDIGKAFPTSRASILRR